MIYVSIFYTVYRSSKFYCRILELASVSSLSFLPSSSSSFANRVCGSIGSHVMSVAFLLLSLNAPYFFHRMQLLLLLLLLLLCTCSCFRTLSQLLHKHGTVLLPPFIPHMCSTLAHSTSVYRGTGRRSSISSFLPSLLRLLPYTVQTCTRMYTRAHTHIAYTLQSSHIHMCGQCSVCLCVYVHI